MNPKLSCPNCHHKQVVSVWQNLFTGLGRRATCPNCDAMLTLPNYTFILALIFVSIIGFFGRNMTWGSLALVVSLIILYSLIYVFIIPFAARK